MKIFEHPDFILKRAMKVFCEFVISNKCKQKYVFEILMLNIIMIEQTILLLASITFCVSVMSACDRPKIFVK